MDETMEHDLRRLMDEREIERLMIRWARALDRQDKALLASVYHPGAVEHHGTFDGAAEDYIEFVIDSAIPSYLSTSHYVTNCLVRVDGHRAHAETLVLAAHIAERDGARVLDLMNARMVDRLERRAGQWGIVERTVVHDWDMTTHIDVVERWQNAFEAGKRGHQDPSYTLLV